MPWLPSLRPSADSPFHARAWRTALALAVSALVGETRAAPLNVPLWDGRPPGFVDNAPPEGTDAAGTVDHVNTPSMDVHLPTRRGAPVAALIVCPGGSYSRVGLVTSGMGTIDAFVPRGVAIIVLKYRTKPPSRDVVTDALADARRAVRQVRLHAAEWNIDPHRVGLVGGSAGAHLVLNLATHWDQGNPASASPVERNGCRPDFIGLLCPWPNRQPVSDFPITATTPPAFIASARDDAVAPTSFAEDIAGGYTRAGVKARLWVIAKGGHTAFKLGANRGEGSRWPERFTAWLEDEVGLPFLTKDARR
ncbi:MAG: alpha/beta hydrolase [Verrucomicrobiota bacterium]